MSPPSGPSDSLDRAETIDVVDPGADALATRSMPPGAPAPVALPGTFPVVDPAVYERGAELARGGMGRIVAAHDLRHDRPVALKEPLSTDPGIVARFHREALITARLQHPAIVPIYEAGQWPDGRPFFAMRQVDGRPLDQAIAARATLAERLALVPTAIAVAEAVAYAHSRGVVHRDLKPHNVLVGAYGETVVIDWGLAKRVGVAEPGLHTGASGDAPAMTQAGGAIGTPSYMPPEQARGEEVDERADVYALGALLYHLLAGHSPYHDTDVPAHAMVEVVASGPPTPIALEIDGVPAELVAIVDKAMAREPAERYRTARELAADLRRFSEGRLVDAHRYPVRTLVWRWARRHRLALSTIGAVVVAALIAAAIYVRGLRVERARTAAQRQVAIAERGRAEAAAARAEGQTRNLLVEHGRQHAVAGRALEAAAYLARAYALGDDSPQVRALLGAVMPTVEAPVLRHGDDAAATVADVAVDAAGATVATVGWDGTLRRWDAATGRPGATAPLVSRGARVAYLAGDVLVTTDDRGGVTRWGADGPAVIATLPTIALTLAVSRDRRRVAVGGVDGTFVVWDEPSRRIVLDVRAPRGTAALGLTADGSAVIAPGHPAGAWWPIATGSIAAGRGGGPRLDGRGVAVADAGTVAVIGETTATVLTPAGAVLATRTGPRAFELVAWSDRALVLVDASPQLERWDDLTAAAPTWRRDLGGARVRALAATATLIALATGDGAIVVLDAATGALLARLRGHDAEVYGVRFTADALISHGGDGAARIWPLAQVLPASWSTAARPLLAHAPTGPGLAWADVDAIALADTPAAPPRRIPIAAPLDDLALGPDVVAGRDATTAYVWDRATGAPIAQRSIAGGPGAIAALTDGRIALAGPTLTLWDPRGGRPDVVVPLDDRAIRARATPDGGVLISTGNRLARHDGAGAQRGAWNDHTSWVTAIDVTAAGQIVVGEASGAVRVYPGPDQPPRRMIGADGTVTAVALTADGTRALAGTAAGGVRVWDVASGRVVAASPEHRGAVVAIAAADPDVAVVTADARGGYRRWRLPLEARPPATITALVERGSPFRVSDDGRLVAADGSPR
ncbi:MAG: protein kinase [Myxococcales bacterium]|nr:protein kinase [Myxococcales bacterium]